LSLVTQSNLANVARKTRKPNSRDRLKKIAISCYLEREDYLALKALSAHTGVPQQVYLRRALAYILRVNDSEQLHAAAATVRARTRELAELSARFAALSARAHRGKGGGRG
jgi:predicted DNA-binding protein